MKWFLKRYVRKFYHAFAGLGDGIRHDASIMLQTVIGVFVIIFCLFMHLKAMEWTIILLLIAAVIALEFVNSAIENVVDMICPHYDVRAKKVKDYAAAAVLIMSLVAVIIGIIILGGKLW